MKKLLALALMLAQLSQCTPSYAQNVTVQNHAFAIGKGPRVSGYTSLLCGSGQIAIGSATDPVCQTLSGDATLNAAGVLTLSTVNANTGVWGGVNAIPQFTLDGKGRVIAAANVTPAIPFTEITGSATLAQMPQLTANSIYINATGSAAQPLSTAVPACANDGLHALVYVNGTGLQCETITSGSGVTSVTPGAGEVSSTTAACVQTAITVTGTISAAHCINSQAGTSYAIADSDRAKLISQSNAAAITDTLAQAGTASNFASGWYTDIQNNNIVGSAGIITINVTTSVFVYAGTTAASLVVMPGQSVRITSDGANFQVTNRVGPGATLQASPTTPTATTSVPGVMMGLGTTCTITPRYSSRVYVHFQSSDFMSVATGAITVQLRFGTGTAPANAAALTGTAVGAPLTPWSAVANAVNAVTNDGIITGLTPGTAIWLDLSLATSTGTATMSSPSCSAFEIN